MSAEENNRVLEQLASDVNAANAAITFGLDRKAVVELDPDHPGFRDEGYRQRRNAIAQIALEYQLGEPIPDAPYSDGENEAWSTICGNLDPVHEEFACKEFLNCKRLMDMPSHRIPQLREVSEKLQKYSGFCIEPAAGLVEPKVFLMSLADGVFMGTQYIRHSSSPLYTPEPDCVHELIGHANTLVDPVFANLNRMFGVAARRTRDEETFERLSRLYWFTVEFGVVMEDGKPKAYGAGLLSSAGELAQLNETPMREFDLDAIEAQDFDVTYFQPFLFAAPSFEEMLHTLHIRLPNW